MSWIKRNLYFVIGSLVSVGLMVLGVIYLIQKNSANNAAYEDWNKQYSELERLQKLNPHPGDAKVNNVKLTRDQIGQLTEEFRKARADFVPIAAIPEGPKVNGEDFTKALRDTISALQAVARNSSVSLPATNYNFTFESIVRKLTVSQNSLQSLAVQLGEVKTISEILFRAKINALENIRRERVCAEDNPETAPNDYLNEKSVTNELAVISPYEVTFRCFSAELAAVLTGFANSSNAFVIKFINIEPSAPSVSEIASEAQPGAFYTPPVAAVNPGQQQAANVAEMYRRRYGLGGPGGAPGGRSRYEQRYTPTPPPPVFTPVAPPAARAPTKGGLETVINERPVKVVAMVEVIKLKEPGAVARRPGPPRSRPPAR